MYYIVCRILCSDQGSMDSFTKDASLYWTGWQEFFLFSQERSRVDEEID